MSHSSNPPLTIVPAEPGESEIQRLDRKLEHFLVALLTILGALPRVGWLDRPTIGRHEAALYGLACGSFASLLQFFRTAHASPLLPMFYWALAHLVNLNPWAMRALPALAGTLMVPAIYLLARQIVSPRAAIVAAAMTACSGYLLGWSRQAQVQAPFWLVVVLNFAALLYWLRTRKAVGYAAWLASGLVMIVLDLAGITALALEVLVFVTFFPQRSIGANQPWRGWMRRLLGFLGLIVLFAIGVGIIGTCGFYGRITEAAAPATMPASASSPVAPASQDSGWSGQVLAGGNGAEIALASFSSALMGWQYPRADQRGGIDPRMMRYLLAGLDVLAVLLLLTLAPWGRQRLISIRLRRSLETLELPKMVPSWRQIPHFERLAQRSWRISLWMLVWLLAPAYLLYQARSHEPSDPRQWPGAIAELIARHWVYGCAILALLAGSILHWIRRHHPITRQDVRRDVIPLGQLAVILMGIYAGALVAWRIAGFVQIPADFLPSHVGFIWAPFAILVAAMIYRIRFARLRRLGIFLLLAINLAIAGLMVMKNPWPRIDLIAHDVVAGDVPRSRTRTFVDLPAHDSNGSIFNEVGDYYLAMESGNSKAAAADHAGKHQTPWKFNRITNERMAVAQAERFGRIDTIIVWDRTENPASTRYGSIKSAGWTLVEDERFPVYDQWTWQRLYTLHRRVFHRGNLAVRAAK